MTGTLAGARFDRTLAVAPLLSLFNDLQRCGINLILMPAKPVASMSFPGGTLTDLIDTHQHLIYRDRFDYGWSDGLPALADKDFTIGDYRRLTADCDVAGTIFMEVDVGCDYRDETRFIAELAANPENNLLGIISSCRPEHQEGFEAWLEECEVLPVVGFRRILHEVDDGLSRGGGFRENVRKIGRRSLVFDMVFRAGQLGVAAELAKACDDMNLVLNHCGVPDIAGGGFGDWRKGISAVAELPHVSCKISGVLAYCPAENATIDAVRPYVEHVIECFGTDRLVWGSDWPVVDIRSGLPEWTGIFRRLVSDLSGDEIDAICNGNARRIYGIGV